MAWTVEWDERAVRELKKLDGATQRAVLKYMRDRIMSSEDPRRFGRALRHELTGLWRYRVGDVRVVCQIQDQQIRVLVLAVGHRKRIHR